MDFGGSSNWQQPSYRHNPPPQLLDTSGAHHHEAQYRLAGLLFHPNVEQNLNNDPEILLEPDVSIPFVASENWLGDIERQSFIQTEGDLHWTTQNLGLDMGFNTFPTQYNDYYNQIPLGLDGSFDAFTHQPNQTPFPFQNLNIDPSRNSSSRPERQKQPSWQTFQVMAEDMDNTNTIELCAGRSHVAGRSPLLEEAQPGDIDLVRCFKCDGSGYIPPLSSPAEVNESEIKLKRVIYPFEQAHRKKRRTLESEEPVRKFYKLQVSAPSKSFGISCEDTGEKAIKERDRTPCLRCKVRKEAVSLSLPN
jgi:hypothetical protein